MGKKVKMLNKYHIKALLERENTDFNNFYKDELMEFIEVSRKENKKYKEMIYKLNNYIEDRMSIIQTKINHKEKDKYYEGKLIGSCKELDLLKGVLKEVE